jgi:hypothetical protein
MVDIEKIDLNKVLEDIHEKMLKISKNPLTPISKYEVETFKRFDDVFFTVKMEVIPGSMDSPPYSWWQRFLQELEFIKANHYTIDEMIAKYKKMLLMK